MQAFTKADVHRLDHKKLYIYKQLGKEKLQENSDYAC